MLIAHPHGEGDVAGNGRRCGRLHHLRAGSPTSLEVALSDELSVGLNNYRTRDPQLASEKTRGRQRGTAADSTGLNPFS